MSIGPTTYLVGGYDGTRPDAPVLAATDGRAFTTVTALRVLRYPAVAALGGPIYVFGGQAITGPHAGAPVNVIQAVDTARRNGGRHRRSSRAAGRRCGGDRVGLQNGP